MDNGPGSSGQKGRAAALWARRWGPVGSKLFLSIFLVAASSLAAFAFTARDAGATIAPFNPGTASASATAIDLAPSLAKLNIAVQLGTSQADLQYNEAQALSQTLDLGVIGDVLEAPSCTNGSPSSVQPSDFPQPVEAESTNGNQSLHSVAATSLNGTGAGIGDEDATATHVPAGTATTSIASDDLAGLVDVLGATTSATTEIQHGDERYATATADISQLSIAQGLIVVRGLHWEATQSSGATPSSSSSFDIGSVSIDGFSVPVSNDSATSILQLLNTTLSPVGFEINWPASTTARDGTVSISPLIVGVDNSALGQEVVGANLNTVQPIRNQLDNELFGLDCNLPGYVEIGDVLLGVPAGGGDLNIELGGASAVTDDQVVSNPFGRFGATSASGAPPAAPSRPAPSPAPAASALLPVASSPETVPSSPVTANPPAPRSLGLVAKSVACRSLGPAGGGCTTSNDALPVGLGGLALLGGLAAWDFVRQRRRGQLAAARGESR